MGRGCRGPRGGGEGAGRCAEGSPGGVGERAGPEKGGGLAGKKGEREGAFPFFVLILDL